MYQYNVSTWQRRHHECWRCTWAEIGLALRDVGETAASPTRDCGIWGPRLSYEPVVRINFHALVLVDRSLMLVVCHAGFSSRLD